MQNRKFHNRKLFVILIFLFAFACRSSSLEKNQPLRPTPGPVLAEGQRIEKVVNVSFSTYSTDWPVGWEWIDPDEKYDPTPHDVKKGVLRMRIPRKKNLNHETNTAPRYLKSITGDFQIETRVKYLPKANYQGAGLLIFKDRHNYIKFERAYGGGGGGEGLRIDVQSGDTYQPIVTPNDIQTDAPQVELKIARNGRRFIAYWRPDPNEDWREAGEFVSDYPDTILAGLIACNTAEEITAEFSYIRLLPYNAH
jgi:beta-xylosidase